MQQVFPSHPPVEERIKLLARMGSGICQKTCGARRRREHGPRRSASGPSVWRSRDSEARQTRSPHQLKRELPKRRPLHLTSRRAAAYLFTRSQMDGRVC